MQTRRPGLLDMSVIRNTNTKIILRLPDEEDRKLVGKSAALKEAQIDELSKLPLGVAAVYQNEWPEAVLCKIEAYPMPENAVYHKPSKMPHEINAEFVFGQLAVGKELEPLSSSEMEQLKLWLKRHETVLKPEDSRYLNGSLQAANWMWLRLGKLCSISLVGLVQSLITVPQLKSRSHPVKNFWNSCRDSTA